MAVGSWLRTKLIDPIIEGVIERLPSRLQENAHSLNATLTAIEAMRQDVERLASRSQEHALSLNAALTAIEAMRQDVHLAKASWTYAKVIGQLPTPENRRRLPAGNRNCANKPISHWILTGIGVRPWV